MLTKDDFQKLNEMMDEKFKEFRAEIKDDILQFKLDIAKGYDHICTELKIVVGYRQMIEDCQEQIDKLKEPRVMVVI